MKLCVNLKVILKQHNIIVNQSYPTSSLKLYADTHTHTVEHDTKSIQVGEHVHVHTCINYCICYMYIWLTVRSMIKGN